ncbi:MAG: PASTA domain-containing protein, partial [Acidimicrobiales bacterium]
LGTVAERTGDAPVGTVVAQDPDAGREWPAGGRVSITLSAPLRVEVPELSGMDQQAAVEALVSRGLVLGTVTPVPAGRAPAARAGSVIGQEPVAGTSAPRGSAVNLQVVLGVPNLVGMDRGAAVAALQALGLAQEVDERLSEDAAGIVLAQEPAPGTPVSTGLVVRLVVAIPATVPVPGVLGLTFVDAAEKMRQATLELVAAGRREADGPEGVVLETDPTAGTAVRRGTQVRATISVARVLIVTVPSLRGLKAEEAKRRCQEASLRFTVGGERPSPDAAPGTVIDQSPSEGKQVQSGTTVTVTVARRDTTVVVPQLLSLPVQKATEVVGQAGLKLAIGDRRLSTQPTGEVLRQDPNPGTRVPVGSTVTVTVAIKGVRVPNVVGKKLGLAEGELNRAGLNVITEEVFDPSRPPGTVMAQVPEGGQLVLEGETVSLTVAIRFRPPE